MLTDEQIKAGYHEIECVVRKSIPVCHVEDVVHDVWIRALLNLEKFEGRKGAKFAAWVRQIARYTVADYYRPGRVLSRSYTSAAVLPPSVSEVSEMQSNIVFDDLLSCTNPLRAEVVRCVIMGLSKPETGRKIGRSLQSVRWQYKEGLRDIRNMVLAEMAHSGKVYGR